MSDTTMRPEDATHTDSDGYYYKRDVKYHDAWQIFGARGFWSYTGLMPAGSLIPLPPVQVVELEKFDAPIAIPEFMRPQMAAPQLPTMPWPSAPFTNYFTKYQFVGSRITCNPPPLDTDQDVLVLVHQSNHAVMERKMFEAGFLKEGSLPAEADTQAGKDNVFHSYRKGDMNYIVTTDEAFYQRFSTATELARKYNLMEKSDRIQLFQAVLYGKWWA